MAIEAASVEATFQLMKEKLGRLIPEVELRIKAELVFEIQRLKRERGAIILGHNYMEPALFYTVPDIVGDSLELSRQAARTDRNPIIFCGVRFMAETAKILNPSRTVLLPAKHAGCSLAQSITAADVKALRQQFPGVPIISYINTYADVKAESDAICTSGNASRVVSSFHSQRIIFLPDEYLASNVARETKRSIVFADDPAALAPATTPQIIGWRGRCEVHEKFTVQDIRDVRTQFPSVTVLAHPECHPDVVESSDYSASTSRMVEFVRKAPRGPFLILTECSMADNIIAENPDKDVLRLCSVRCPHMNEITLEDTLTALRENRQEIDVPEPIRSRAKKALDYMLQIQ